MSWFRLLFTVRGTALPRIRGRLFAVFLVSVVATVTYEYTGRATDLTTIPFTLISLALGVFLGFRNNTAYERYWEARKLWGRLVNDSRSFARMVLTIIQVDATPHPKLEADGVAELKRELIYRVIAYVHALRMHLRNELDQLGELRVLLPEAELAALPVQRNVPNALLLRLGQRVEEARRLGVLRNRDVWLLEGKLNDITNVQGGCERIRSTPMP